MAELQGIEELRRKLRVLPEQLQLKGFRSGMRKAANAVRDRARTNAQGIDDPVTRESIPKNLFVKFSTRAWRQNKDIKFRVGILGGAQTYANTKENVRKGRAGAKYLTGGSSTNPGGDTWYWRFQEFGVPGRGIPARPFLAPALANNIGQTIDIATEAISNEIDKAVAKLGK